MKNSIPIKKIFMIFSLLTIGLFSSAVFAAPSQIVLFCSSWNMKCREARKACSSAALEQGIKFIDLDIDQSYSQQKADDLGLNFPSTIPYIYVLDNKGKILKGKLYKGESYKDLKQELINY